MTDKLCPWVHNDEMYRENICPYETDTIHPTTNIDDRICYCQFCLPGQQIMVLQGLSHMLKDKLSSIVMGIK